MNQIKRNLDFILIKIILAYKENKEYKINLWSAFLVNFVIIVVNLGFFKVYNNLTGDLINWDYIDFVIYSFITLAGSKIYHIFSLKHFNLQLLNGNLNLALIRPINPFLFQSLLLLKGPVLLIAPILLIIMYILIFINNYSNILLFTIHFIFVTIYSSFFYSLLQMTAFFFKQNNFLFDMIFQLNGVIKLTTPKVFESYKLHNILFILPNAIFGFLSVLILKNETQLYYNLLPFLIITFIIIIFLSFLIFTYGIKKYEAYG